MLRDSVALNRSARLEFAGGDLTSQWVPIDTARGVTNYRVGRDPRLWISGVPHHSRLRRAAIYPGVDVELYGAEGRLEYDFVLRPGADPSSIRMRFRGADSITLDVAGDLMISTPAGGLIQRRPFTYQQSSAGRQPVEAHYVVLGPDEVGLAVAEYDTAATLTVDPVIESLALFGGSGNDRIFAAGPDYLVGTTESPEFGGAVSMRHHGSDVFIYAPTNGNTWIVGGSGDEVVTSVSGRMIGGYTNSTDLPTTPPAAGSRFGGAQATYGGGSSDGFVMMLYSGSQPSIISYVGGSGDDRILSVCDKFGSASTLAPYYVAGTTTSTDLVPVRAWQTAPVGAFVASFDYQGNTLMLSYLGGSDGTDLPRAMWSAAANDVYVAGETRSTDWTPATGWIGSRQGASDGFVVHLQAQSDVSPYAISGALLIGGGGEDSIAAMAPRRDGQFFVAGTTSSAEVSGYHGGPSDAFALMVPADLQNQGGLVLIGGSGAEEATSIAVNQYNEVAVGGVTTSQDMPLKDPIQANYGGGESDGFIYYADSFWNPFVVTYLGGNGSDRVHALQFDSAQRIYAGGASTSTDLPLNPYVTGNAGGWDGFQAVLRASFLHAAELSVGKDLAGVTTVQLGDPTNATGVPLTVTSGDPERVQLAVRPGDPGAASVTIAYRAGTDLAARSFRVYCLADNGTIPLTLGAPGYDDRTMNVRCLPSVINVTPIELRLQRVALYSTPPTLSVYAAPLDPDSGRVLAAQSPRPGAPVLQIDAVVSDPNVLQLSASQLVFTSFSDPSATSPTGFQVSALTAGTADVALTATSGWAIYPGSTIHAQVTDPAASLYAPYGFQDMLTGLIYGPRLSMTGGSAPMSITLKSSDPSKVRLTVSPDIPGAESVTGTCVASGGCTPVYLEVLDASGEVSISAFGENGEPTEAPVRFLTVLAGLYSETRLDAPETEASMLTSGSVSRTARIGVTYSEYGLPTTFALLRAGVAPVEIRLASSDPSVVPPTGTPMIWYPGAQFSWPLTLSGKAAGTTQLTLSTDRFGLRATPLRVSVRDQPVTIPEDTVGKDLQIRTGFGVTGNFDLKERMVTITSGDPSRLVLSQSLSTPGQASVSMPINSYGSVVLQALAGSGDVELTTTTTGFPPSTSIVHLAPSGIGWTSNRHNLANTPSGPRVAAFVLDPQNLTALEAQQVRPGRTGEISITNANPEVATLRTSSLPLSSFQGEGDSPSVGLDVTGGGEAVLTITQPEGFTEPTSRGSVRVTVPRPGLGFDVSDLGRNLQSGCTVSSPGNNPAAQITVTSADPSKLVISTSSSDLGSGSVTVRRRQDGSYAPLYLQALDGPADVKVTATADGFDPVERAVRIFPTALILSRGDTWVQDPQVFTSASADSVDLYVCAVALSDAAYQGQSSYLPSRDIRPGLDTIRVRVENSNPSVASVQDNPVLLNSLTDRSRFRVKPLRGGETQLSLTIPPGFAAPPPGLGRTARIAVEGPAFTLSSFPIAKNLQGAVTLALANNGATVSADVEVTLTSSDGSKLLLSETGDAVGAESIQVHFAADSVASRTVYLQALASDTTATVSVTAPSYGSSQTVYSLYPATLRPDISFYELQPGGPVTRILLKPKPYGWNTDQPLRFRPGLPAFEVTASTSDSSVLTLLTPKLSISGGTAEVFLEIRTVGAGTATITLESPNLTPSQPFSVRVQSGTLSVNSVSTIGKDLQSPVTVYSTSEAPTLTVTSSDPARLVLSTSPTTLGQQSLVLSTQAGRQTQFYAQALASSGNVTITAKAPGFIQTTQTIQLSEAIVYVRPQMSWPTLTTLSSPIDFNVGLCPRNSYSNAGQAPRPGAAPITTTIRTTDAAVGSIIPSEIVFGAGDPATTFRFQPLTPGSTLLSATVPAGFADSPTDRQQLLTVLAPRLNAGNAWTVGRDLIKAISISIAGGTAKPVTLTLASSDPSRLLLRTAANPTPAASVNLEVAGTSGATATLVGLASSGTVQIKVSGPGFPAMDFDVSLRRSGFRISSTPAPTTAGSSGSVYVTACELTPGTLAPGSDATLRPGLDGIPVILSSSNTSVATGSTAIFLPGDSSRSFYFTTKAPGSAIFTLILPDGYFLPSTGGTATLSVR